MKNISFYVPTLNSQATIIKCLESILQITDKVIVIDGGSTDKTVEMVKSLNVRLHKDLSKNLANARNLAIKDCKTKYIAFVDSDVEIKKEWLENIMKQFSKEIAGVCGRLEEKYCKTIADEWRAFHLKQNWGSKEISPKFLFGSNSVYRVKALKEVGGFNVKFKTNYEDVDISQRLKNGGYKIAYAPKAIALHLKQDNIISVVKMARKWSFFSYEVPDTFFKLLKRIFIYNSHYLLHQIKKDFSEPHLLPITLLTFFYNFIYDVNYYKSA